MSSVQDIIDELEEHDCNEYCDHNIEQYEDLQDDIEKLIKKLEKSDSMDSSVITIAGTEAMSLRDLIDELESIKD